jgi:predicted MFS family arabinose efflux permease
MSRSPLHAARRARTLRPEETNKTVTLTERVPALAPFRIRSFCFQWPADLLASWAFEMEGVILGWFVLVSTGSVLALAIFGSLQFLGTLISPFFGLAGDRIGNRNLICMMRAAYIVIALIFAVLFLLGQATPVAVFGLGIAIGLVRPSDMTLRNLLVGETMPSQFLMPAMGISRTTADSARVVGALSGAGLVAALGAGPAYVVITAVYIVSLLLSLKVGVRRLRVVGETEVALSPIKALREGFAYVWSTADVRAATLLAFLMNFAAYPFVGQMLAHVAKDIYGLDQTGLGWLIACFALGALAGSLTLSARGAWIRPARTMLVGALLWFALNLVFAWITVPLPGELVLIVIGFVQSFCMVPMAVLLLRTADPKFRGRVMGVRMLAVYGLPLGMLLSGPLIERIGFAWTGTLYSLAGLGLAALIALRWREQLWRRDSPANRR